MNLQLALDFVSCYLALKKNELDCHFYLYYDIQLFHMQLVSERDTISGVHI